MKRCKIKRCRISHRSFASRRGKAAFSGTTLTVSKTHRSSSSFRNTSCSLMETLTNGARTRMPRIPAARLQNRPNVLGATLSPRLVLNLLLSLHSYNHGGAFWIVCTAGYQRAARSLSFFLAVCLTVTPRYSTAHPLPRWLWRAVKFSPEPNSMDATSYNIRRGEINNEAPRLSTRCRCCFLRAL